jgi:hypothetical protein
LNTLASCLKAPKILSIFDLAVPLTSRWKFLSLPINPFIEMVVSDEAVAVTSPKGGYLVIPPSFIVLLAVKLEFLT